MKTMKFFIPHAQNEQKRDSIYRAIKEFAKQQLEWDINDRKIFSIQYRHDGKDHYAEVGKKENYLGAPGEEVIAILESNTYLICTPNRGVMRGMPILVGKNDAYSVINFE